MITITESRKEHIAALRNLFFNTRRSAFSWADPLLFQLADFDTATKGEYILVAAADDRIVGFIAVWVMDNFIHHLYVDEKFQHQGVGTQLLNAALAKLNLPVNLKCEENNTNAVRFYQRKGFVEKERGESSMGNYILFELN